jgi:indolepyruvate decarboxylase
VTTCGELDEAIKTAEARGTGAYIEVVTDKYAAAPLAQKFHESVETLYAT